jgi:hypothetical protein
MPAREARQATDGLTRGNDNVFSSEITCGLASRYLRYRWQLGP